MDVPRHGANDRLGLGLHGGLRNRSGMRSCLGASIAGHGSCLGLLSLRGGSFFLRIPRVVNACLVTAVAVRTDAKAHKAKEADQKCNIDHHLRHGVPFSVRETTCATFGCGAAGVAAAKSSAWRAD